ncbi:biotin-dependent carboxyltransferase [Spiractinospora alimapuensis]|uniref:5-oxoprolinase subunit C family protein n=1 Tax=Spiractinospora alimapuensis TaxID=2820884 RepID=UPI001F42E6A2|nr:biotin-dependent carboxyltransferase family protein [Spiractinospora alimapuensis]QVQ50198.1 biotin-dependent carboxyltransferase [Spiractinospora alimapuensis]
MSDVLVRKGGLHTTVQDKGRDGYYSLGMPPSGAMDQYSYRVANMLVGNPDGAAALEATYVGPTLEFTDDRYVAVTGADAPVTINGEPVERWSTLRVRAGDVLEFAMLSAGARLYVAVSGGIGVEEYLGSRSTYTLTGLGGFQGRALKDDDRLPLDDDGATPPAVGSTLTEKLRPAFPHVATLRTMIGLCSYRVTKDSMREFSEVPWKVTKDADRIGYRLRGGRLRFVDRKPPHGAGSDPANVVDLGYPIGSIQVPGGDEPIVLLNDAVTAGGYATVGTVISVDRDTIAQTKSGDQVRFEPVDLDTALAARRDRRDRLERARASLRR